jgi:hydrogenase maturation protease
MTSAGSAPLIADGHPSVRVHLKAAPPRIAILGAGNLLLGDDGVGVHAVRALEADPPEGVLVCEVGTRSLAVLDILEDSDAVVVVDAMQAGGTPGSIYRYEVRADEPYGMHGGSSLHDLNIVGALRFLPEERRPRVIVVGVEPSRLECTLELSDIVAAVLPEVVSCARRVAEELITAER